MEENMIVNGQELVEKAEEKLMDAATNLDNAIAVTKQTAVPAISQPKKSYKGTNLAVGAGLVLGSGTIGFAIDHWVLPYFSEEARDARKAKKAEKKAAKEAKKAKGKKGKKPADKKAEPAKKPETESGDEDGIDPNDIPTEE